MTRFLAVHCSAAILACCLTATSLWAKDDSTIRWHVTGVQTGVQFDRPPKELAPKELQRRTGIRLSGSVKEYVQAVKGQRYTIHVPSSYDPVLPHGLLIYADPVNSPESNYDLSGYRLIMVSVDRDDDYVGDDDAITAAFMVNAAHHMPRYFNIDPDRVYLADMHAHANVAVATSIGYSEYFDGVVNYSIAPSWERIDGRDATMKRPSRTLLENARHIRFVFVAASRSQYESMNRAEQFMTREGLTAVAGAGDSDAVIGTLEGPLFERTKNYETTVRLLRDKGDMEGVLYEYHRALLYGHRDAQEPFEELLIELYEETGKGLNAVLNGDEAIGRLILLKVSDNYGGFAGLAKAALAGESIPLLRELLPEDAQRMILKDDPPAADSAPSPAPPTGDGPPVGD